MPWPAQANPHDQVKLDIHKKIARWLYGRNIQPPPNHLFSWKGIKRKREWCFRWGGIFISLLPGNYICEILWRDMSMFVLFMSWCHRKCSCHWNCGCSIYSDGTRNLKNPTACTFSAQSPSTSSHNPFRIPMVLYSLSKEKSFTWSLYWGIAS